MRLQHEPVRDNHAGVNGCEFCKHFGLWHQSAERRRLMPTQPRRQEILWSPIAVNLRDFFTTGDSGRWLL
jgi:hypothetical protein